MFISIHLVKDMYEINTDCTVKYYRLMHLTFRNQSDQAIYKEDAI